MARRRKKQLEDQDEKERTEGRSTVAEISAQDETKKFDLTPKPKKATTKLKAVSGTALIQEMGLTLQNWEERWKKKFTVKLTAKRLKLETVAGMLNQEAIQIRLPVNADEIETRTQVEMIPVSINGHFVWVPRGGAGVKVPECVAKVLFNSGHVDGNEMRMHFNAVRASMGKRRVADARRIAGA